jgi:hypothetical protein
MELIEMLEWLGRYFLQVNASAFLIGSTDPAMLNTEQNNNFIDRENKHCEARSFRWQ